MFAQPREGVKWSVRVPAIHILELAANVVGFLGLRRLSRMFAIHLAGPLTISVSGSLECYQRVATARGKWRLLGNLREIHVHKHLREVRDFDKMGLV